MDSKNSQPSQRTKRNWHLKHDPDFKRQVALEYLESGRSARQIAAKYRTVDFTQVAAWARALKTELKLKASLNPSSVASPRRKDVILDSAEYQDLKKQLETAKLRIAGLETMIDIADEHLGVQIRKKYGTKQS